MEAWTYQHEDNENTTPRPKLPKASWETTMALGEVQLWTGKAWDSQT